MMKFLVFLVSIAVCHASCPNSCSGNGKCGEFDKCTCFARWVGNDCSRRECPFGLSWVGVSGTANDDAPAGGKLGGLHAYTVCSSRGQCSESGECECFPGYTGRACSRTTCPNECSGHGRCLYNNEDGYGTATQRFNSQFWDAAKTRQCACDRGYVGLDCSSRICPKGDDPLTTCNQDGATIGTSKNDQQTISVAGPAAGTSHFTITFQDMYNGKYTTRPVKLKHSTGAERVATAKDAKDSLEELPNFAIPNVTVAFHQSCSGTCTCNCAGTCSDIGSTTKPACDTASGTWTCSTAGTTDTGCTTGTSVTNSAACDAKTGCAYVGGSTNFVFTIDFVDAANSGKQNTLVVNKANQNTANFQPRFAKNDATFTVAHTALASTDAYKESAECSNRGTCDSESGLCECFEGYTGEACSDQTVFF